MTGGDAIQFATFRRVAEEAARAAGAIARAGFGGALEIRAKGPKDIVTQYDTAAEGAALEVVRGRFPEHAIVAEESDPERLGSALEADWYWTIDPIDGTHNYAMQVPFWCVSVAVAEARSRSVVAAAVFDPVHDELFSAALGGGATLNGSPVHVSSTSDLGQASAAFDLGYTPDVAKRLLEVVTRVHPNVRRIRLLGSSVLALTFVAAGRIDSYFHLRLFPWDIASPSLLIAEAGGVATDWEGRPLQAGETSVVASNASLHRPLLSLLNDSGDQAKGRR